MGDSMIGRFGAGLKNLVEQLIDNETLILVFLFVAVLKAFDMAIRFPNSEVTKIIAASTIAAIIGGFIGYLKGATNKRNGKPTEEVPPVVEDGKK